MNPWLRALFGRDVGLFGPPLRLLDGEPETPAGHVRAGHLSVELRRRASGPPPGERPGQRYVPPTPPKDEQAGARYVPPVPPKQEQHAQPYVPPTPPASERPQGRGVPMPPPRGAAGRALVRPRTSPAAVQQRPPAPAPAPRPAVTQQPRPAAGATAPRVQMSVLRSPAAAGRSQLRMGLSGLGDVQGLPFKANAKVWVTNQVLPLRGVNPETGGPGDPVAWPDGSMAGGVYWLPQLDLSSTFVPGLPGTWWQGDDPLTRTWPDGSERRQQRGAGWIASRAAQDMFGGPAWEWLIDYGKGREENGFGSAYPEPPGGGAAWEAFYRYYFTAVENVDRDITDWQGHTARINRYAASFDWSRYAPTVQAPIYIWLNLFDPMGITWTVEEAEVYRADRQDVATAGEPTTLPGPAWLCLDVLDAMVTGAHGMPVLIRDDGALDRVAYTQFLADYPAWRPLLDYGRNNDGMLAVVNDLGPGAGRVIHEEPAPPPAPPKPPKPPGDIDSDLVSWFSRHQGGGGGNTVPPPPPGGNEESIPPPPPGDDYGGFLPPGGGGDQPLFDDGRAPGDSQTLLDDSGSAGLSPEELDTYMRLFVEPLDAPDFAGEADDSGGAAGTGDNAQLTSDQVSQLEHVLDVLSP